MSTRLIDWITEHTDHILAAVGVGLVLVLVLALVPSALSAGEGVSVTSSHLGLSGVRRHVDNEAGVVCWVYAGVEKGGIDCLPISETRLR